MLSHPKPSVLIGLGDITESNKFSNISTKSYFF